MSKLSKRLENGINRWCAVNGKTLEELRKYVCVGGDGNGTAPGHKWRLEYFHHIFGMEAFPPGLTDHCICGAKIRENCYITPESKKIDDIITLGNCCIENFMNEVLKQKCIICQKTHKRQSDILYCDEHKPSIPSTPPKTRGFYKPRAPKPNKCRDCGHLCGTFIRCFKCHEGHVYNMNPPLVIPEGLDDDIRQYDPDYVYRDGDGPMPEWYEGPILHDDD